MFYFCFENFVLDAFLVIASDADRRVTALSEVVVMQPEETATI